MFICMCGPAGSGKSTMAEVLAKRYNATIISTDRIRKELFGDEAVQAEGNKVFRIAYDRIETELRKNHIVIFDATNLLPSWRTKVLEYAKTWNKGFNVCYWSKTDIETAKERNLNRKRVVPEYVIENQFEKFVIPTYDEGWDAIFEF